MPALQAAAVPEGRAAAVPAGVQWNDGHPGPGCECAAAHAVWGVHIWWLLCACCVPGQGRQVQAREIGTSKCTSETPCRCHLQPCCPLAVCCWSFPAPVPARLPLAACPQSSYFKWMRNQTVLSGFYLLYLIAVVVNFLGCLWCVLAVGCFCMPLWLLWCECACCCAAPLTARTLYCCGPRWLAPATACHTGSSQRRQRDVTACLLSSFNIAELFTSPSCSPSMSQEFHCWGRGLGELLGELLRAIHPPLW